VSPSWLSAIAALATFLVVLISAIAALIQLRHMRNGNQIAILTGLGERVDSREFTAASQFVAEEVPRRLSDPAGATTLANMPPFVGDNAAILEIANFWEMVGLLIKRGMLDEDLVCDVFAQRIDLHWNALSPIVTTVRADANQGVWGNFEYLSVLVDRYNVRRPMSYPKNFPRKPVDTSLLALRKGKN
jgi:hypothetical protein